MVHSLSPLVVEFVVAPMLLLVTTMLLQHLMMALANSIHAQVAQTTQLVTSTLMLLSVIRFSAAMRTA
jgi:hypothetical protein